MTEDIHPDDPRFVLKPCPFCGSEDIKKAARIAYRVYTSCRNCGTDGPVRLTGREADLAWNERKEATP